MTTLLALPGVMLALALATIGGGLVLLRARLGWGPVDQLVRVLLGLALLVAFSVHAAVGLSIAMVVVAATWRGHGLEDAVLEDARKPGWICAGALALALVASALRPPVPLFASESALLGLARSVSLGEAIEGARTLPVIASALALSSDSLGALTLGGRTFGLLAFALFALLASRTARGPFDEALPLLVLASTPLVWVHLRCVSVDLALGLLAASMAMAMERTEEGDRLGPPAAIASALLLGVADPGVVLAVAILVGFLATSAVPAARRTGWIAVACLLVSVTAQHGALWPRAEPRLDQLVPLARESLRHVTDVQTWGLAPAVGLAAVASSLRPRAAPRSRPLALALVLAAAMLLLTLTLAEVELRERALEGGLLNRLFLGLLPLSALLVARALGSDAVPHGAGTTSKT